MKYPYNEYLQTIITIRIQLGWVKRKEGCKCRISIKLRNNFKFHLKGLCQLESMRSEVMQITFNCQNSIVFNA